jgi:hypothetical protein
MTTSGWHPRCDVCGCYIPFEHLADETALRRLVYPDSEFTIETYETLCWKHNVPKNVTS